MSPIWYNVCLRIAVRVLFFFFFFQAEDGIRDIGVTGVQTCALPIFGEPSGSLRRRGSPTPIRHPPDAAARSEERRVGKECRSRGAPDHEKKKKGQMLLQRFGHSHKNRSSH